MPNLLGHPDNYIYANPMVTPPHIVPEWYFLPFYAILRSIPNKLAGVIALALAIIALFLVPFLQKPDVRSMEFRLFSKIFFVYFCVVCILLGWCGSQPVNYPYLFLSQFITLLYFLYFFVLAPFIIFLESYLWTPKYSDESNAYLF